jgi:hypothetical protein
MSASAWGQEVSLYGTTMAQMWKEGTPGFDKATFTPATQYLGIDATKLGTENLSLHLFGWGRTDLSDVSSFDGKKTGGYLNYGYLQYRFDRANAEIKAGRFTVNQSTGFEQVDGVSARTDLVNGFTVSAFAGKPVLYKTVDPVTQKDYDFQRDVMFGARLGWRMGRMAEVGLSYLQDGSKSAKDLAVPSTTDYTRKQLGADISFTPISTFDVRGRTVADVRNERTQIAEHDYTATVKLGSQVSLAGNYAARDFQYFFVGTNLPSLFRQNENDAFRGMGGKLTWLTATSFQMSVDYRHMHRDTFGDANRIGTDLRWDFKEKTVLVGVGAHVVNADAGKTVDPAAPYKSISHREARVWTMVSKGRFTASLDGIVQHYESGNPYLAGMRLVYEGVGSLGFQATSNVKVSGDISYGSNPVAKHETRGLLKAEYRFGTAKKGGK